MLRGLERVAAFQDGPLRQGLTQNGAEQLPGPRQGGLKRGMTRWPMTSPREQLEALGEAAQDALRCQDPAPRCGEFQRQGQTI
jgi:hypothetical protein